MGVAHFVWLGCFILTLTPTTAWIKRREEKDNGVNGVLDDLKKIENQFDQAINSVLKDNATPKPENCEWSLESALSSILLPGDTVNGVWHENATDYFDIFTEPSDLDKFIEVDMDETDQVLEGFGATLTNKAANLIYNSPFKQDILSRLFGDNDLGLNVLRIPMGGTDTQAVYPYTYDDMPAGEDDPNMEHFSVEQDHQFIIPLIQEIKDVRPDIRIIAVPWTAPAWMKKSMQDTCGALRGGQFNGRDDIMESYAKYFLEFIRAYEAANITIDAISIQNEPLHQNSDFPSMRMTYEDMGRFVASHLGLLLQKEDIEIDIFVYGDNWDDIWYPKSVYAVGSAKHHINGIAFHCGAQPQQNQLVNIVHQQHPDAKIYLTQCKAPSSEDSENLYFNVASFVSQLRQGAQVAMLWDLASNETSGGILGVNDNSPKVYNLIDYYSLYAFSHFLKPGLIRIGSTSHNPKEEFVNVAFSNGEDEVYIVVGNGALSEPTISIKFGEKYFRYAMFSTEVITLKFVKKCNDDNNDL